MAMGEKRAFISKWRACAFAAGCLLLRSLKDLSLSAHAKNRRRPPTPVDPVFDPRTAGHPIALQR